MLSGMGLVRRNSEGDWEGGAHGEVLPGLLLAYPDDLQMWEVSSPVEGI